MAMMRALDSKFMDLRKLVQKLRGLNASHVMWRFRCDVVLKISQIQSNLKRDIVSRILIFPLFHFIVEGGLDTLELDTA